MDMSADYEEPEETLTFNILSSDNPLKITIPSNPKTGFKGYSKKQAKLHIDSFYHCSLSDIDGIYGASSESTSRIMKQGLIVRCPQLSNSEIYDENGKSSQIVEFFPAKYRSIKRAHIGYYTNELGAQPLNRQELVSNPMTVLEYSEKSSNSEDGIVLGNAIPDRITLEFSELDMVCQKQTYFTDGSVTPAMDAFNGVDLTQREQTKNFNFESTAFKIETPSPFTKQLKYMQFNNNKYFIRLRLCIY